MPKKAVKSKRKSSVSEAHKSSVSDLISEMLREEEVKKDSVGASTVSAKKGSAKKGKQTSGATASPQKRGGPSTPVGVKSPKKSKTSNPAIGSGKKADAAGKAVSPASMLIDSYMVDFLTRWM